MNNILRRTGTDITEPLRRLFEGDLDTWLRTEEYKENGTLVIKAEVPGIDPEKDVDITMTGDQLRITVRHEEKSEHTGKEGYRSEFRYGTFSRAVTLPGAADQSDVKATYIDGILEVRVPLPEQEDTGKRKIPIVRG
ncbi:Hsp20/alpha crystallin family protein [Pseudarthrobacter sp. NS4]|uniref:Hsp20/alpha crystallin family protein n=1 Tax=Pseudarthrobacter sp. NS4 TaxID=2973976 RepID=UPI002162F2FA|nr:Hsp20/alpha crystallin family protein [Pseudarthrobacter sp. NS4]